MPLVERSHSCGCRFFLLQMEVSSFRTTPLQYSKKKKKKKKLEQVLKDMLDLLLWVRNSHYILCKTGNAGELKAVLIMMFYN